MMNSSTLQRLNHCIAFLLRFRLLHVKNTRLILLAELKSCTRSRDLARGKDLHETAIRNGDGSDLWVANALVNMYAKCGSIENARMVFDQMQYRDVVSWTALVMGYAENGKGAVSLDLFSRMKSEGCLPNSMTCVAALKACIEEGSRHRGSAVHLLASRNGWDVDVYVDSILVDMYAKLGTMEDAQGVFDRMRFRDVVCWTALILGYADNGEEEIALDVFQAMSNDHNARSFVAALKACAHLAAEGDASVWNRGESLHLLACIGGYDSDMYVQNTLVDMYAKCGSMDQGQAVFDRMRYRDVVSWNALILGYANNGEGSLVLRLFARMKSDGCQPDSTTYVAALKACGILGALELGKSVHAEIPTQVLETNVVLANCLVDLYARCGSLAEAERVFYSHTRNDVVTWNTLMAGYSHHGYASAVFNLLDRMVDAGVQPNEVTLLTVLGTCSHAGLVEKGKSYFDSMASSFGVIPRGDHYACMVDILGRANELDEAIVLLRGMRFNPNVSTWTALLGACRKSKNAHLGRLTFESLTSLDGMSSGAYVLMGSMSKSLQG